jgi:dihydroflavonol-4-reductase
LAANSSRLEVVVVNPSIMISPPDRPVTERDLRKIPKFLPAYFDFGLNVVETDDVIFGIIGAIEKGRPGERYLLTGENVNPHRLFELSKRYFGISKPLIKIPVSSLYLAALLTESWAKLTGKNPKFHRGLARLAHLRFFYSCEKAKRELGYNPKPLEKTIEAIIGKLKVRGTA